MPEGDAVRRTARRLDTALAGQVLVAADLRVPRLATVDLTGAEVVGTAARGKHLLTRMRHRSRELTLHHHLRMDGTWITGQPGTLRVPGHQVRAVLATAGGEALGIRIHMLELVRTTDEDRLVGHLGPDIMAEDFAALPAAGIIAGSGLALVPALLDQRLVAGMGTMWAAECAWLAGAHPLRDPAQCPGLAEALTRVRAAMLAALDEQPRARRAALHVFERAGQPCRRCGHRIRAGKVGRAPYDRPTYWCPSCQPG